MRHHQFNDSPAWRRRNWLVFCIGLAGFLIVLALVLTFLYDLAKAVRP